MTCSLARISPSNNLRHPNTIACNVSTAPCPFTPLTNCPLCLAPNSAAFSDKEIARLAKFQVLAIEKWYTACGSKGPTQSGPECAVEEQMVALFKQTKAITPNQTTIMYWNTELDFSMYSAHAKMEYMEAKGTPVYLRDETGT